MHQDALLESAPVLLRGPPRHRGDDKTLGKTRAAAQLRRPIKGVHHDPVTAAQRLLVRFDHVVSFIVSANHSAM